MKSISLSAVNGIYACCEHLKVNWHPVAHPAFRDFCLALKQFARTLDDTAQDEYWKVFLGPLRQYRFVQCATPLPFNHLKTASPEVLAPLQQRVTQCGMIYPQFTAPAHDLFQRLTRVLESAANPLLDALVELRDTAGKGNAALLLKESHTIPAVEQLLAAHPALQGLSVVGASQLRGGTCYQSLIVIGPTRWFPDCVFSAPHASRIHIIHYNWIKDAWQPSRVFDMED